MVYPPTTGMHPLLAAAFAAARAFLRFSTSLPSCFSMDAATAAKAWDRSSIVWGSATALLLALVAALAAALSAGAEARLALVPPATGGRALPRLTVVVRASNAFGTLTPGTVSVTTLGSAADGRLADWAAPLSDTDPAMPRPRAETARMARPRWTQCERFSTTARRAVGGRPGKPEKDNLVKAGQASYQATGRSPRPVLMRFEAMHAGA